MMYSKNVELLEPIDLSEHLDKVELYLGQVCQIAGIELGAGIYVNSLAPETAAAALREAR